jgi:hypothetical protein
MVLERSGGDRIKHVEEAVCRWGPLNVLGARTAVGRPPKECYTIPRLFFGVVVTAQNFTNYDPKCRLDGGK